MVVDMYIKDIGKERTSTIALNPVQENEESLEKIYEKTIRFNDSYRNLLNEKSNQYETNLKGLYGMIKDILEYAPRHPYTGLPYYTAEMQTVLDKAINSRMYTHALILDVMNLKRVNEIEGYKNHKHGDVYLYMVGEALKRYFRPEDMSLMSMFGGDEIIILMNMDSPNAYKPEEIINKRINEVINPAIREMFLKYTKENKLPYNNDFEVGLHYKLVDLKDIEGIEDLRKTIIFSS